MPRQRKELAVLLAAVPTLAALIVDFHGPFAVALTLAGFGGSVVAARTLDPDEPAPKMLWVIVAAMAILAVAREPLGSHDLWSYAFEGRMVSHYGVDPYSAVPAQFPSDILTPVVGWKNSAAGYGPMFIAFSALATWLGGESLTAIRLFFQVSTALAVIACLVLVDRARKTRALVLVALAPFVWTSLVNGGHNDALIAIGLLCAVLAFDRGRMVLAGALIAATGLIKIPGFFALVPLLVLLLHRRRWRDGVALSAFPGAAVLLSAIFLPASLHNASENTRGKVSRASIWRPIQLLTTIPAATLTALSLGLFIVLIGVISWRRRRDTTAALSSGAGLSVFGFSTSYSLIWYQIWGLPLVALSGDLVLTALVTARGSIMQASYQISTNGSAAVDTRGLLSILVPPILFVAFLWRALSIVDESTD